jgi:hypothetical protein
MDRTNQYENAFEAYLQHRRLCYVAVDETHRAPADDAPIKSLDFIVHGQSGAGYLVDVKGRRFPGGPPGRERKVWECWSTLEDIDGLERWRGVFGPEYRGLLVFAYRLADSVSLPESTEDLWDYRGRRFLFRAVPVADYRKEMRLRSPKWQTVTLPNASFRRLVRPISHFTQVSGTRNREPGVGNQELGKPESEGRE